MLENRGAVVYNWEGTINILEKTRVKKDIIRQEQLVSELNKKGKLTIHQVTELLRVSESTARRIIIELEERKLLLRCFGGIQSLPTAGVEYSFDVNKNQMEEEKMTIGQRAAGLVQDFDSIFLSAGSTVKQMACAIQKRLIDNDLKDITVITNSMAVLEILSNYCNIMIVGGVYRKKSQDVVGSLAEKNMNSMRFHKAFIGTVSVDVKEGLMTLDMEINSIMEVAISRAREVYVLADSSKFDKTAFTRYAMAEEVTAVITDSGLEPERVQRYTDIGASVIIADL